MPGPSSPIASKTICLPSGDHLGEPQKRLNQVNRTKRWPSLPHTQISQLPERLEAKTILLPSGENRISTSILVEVIKGCGVACGFAPLSSSIRQMLESSKSCTQARRLP